LHYALRRVLGEQAQQKGSLVEPDRLRFDFTSGRALTADEKSKVEDLVNEKVLLNAPVETEVMPIDVARKKGRWRSSKKNTATSSASSTMTADSVELCGGTHARATGDIGLFKIVSEGGIAAGVRRIEATTGMKALRYVRSLESTLGQRRPPFRAGGSDLVEKIERVVAASGSSTRRSSSSRRSWRWAAAGEARGRFLARARRRRGTKVLGVAVEVADMGALREMAEKLRDRLGDAVVLVGSKSGAKVAARFWTVSKALVARGMKAPDLIRPIAQVVAGRGAGGRTWPRPAAPTWASSTRQSRAWPQVVASALGVGDQPTA